MNKQQKFIVFGLTVLLVFGVFLFDSYADDGEDEPAIGYLTVQVSETYKTWSVRTEKYTGTKTISLEAGEEGKEYTLSWYKEGSDVSEGSEGVTVYKNNTTPVFLPN